VRLAPDPGAPERAPSGGGEAYLVTAEAMR
jgi:hypothetical protein